jgi:hypothetical protein
MLGVLAVSLQAQEPQAIPSEELAKATELLMDANTRLGNQPFKLELAPDQAAGFKVGDVGAIIIPDRRLKTEKAKGAAPVALAARKTGEEGGVLELKLLGRFKAEIPVGKQAE